MKTVAEYAAWLADDTAQRVTLYTLTAQRGGVETTRYVSNKPYPGYMAAVSRDLEITESISLDGAAKLSAGDLGLHNIGGELDGWLDDIWLNRSATVQIGDVRWQPDDFHTVFVGVQGDVAPDGLNAIKLGFRDIMQNLNTPVSEVKLSGDVLCPVAIGEVPNMSPKYDAASGKFYYHTGPTEGLIEPRTDGKKRTSDVTDEAANGRLGFNDAVGPGVLTCSVQGDKTGGIYRTTIAAQVQLLVTSYGKASTRLTAADIDAASFAAFDAANPQPVGLGLFERENVLDACSRLASSKGAQMIPSRLGKLRLIQYAIPNAAALDIPRSMQVAKSLTLVARTSAQAAVKIAYCRNYTVQQGLRTSLPDAHKQMFALEWRTYTAIDAATATAYKLNVDPVQRETCLLKLADAQDEGDRLLAIVKVPRKTYQVELGPPGLLVELGQARNLFNDRFGLSAGKPGLVTKLTVNYGTYHTIAEITV